MSPANAQASRELILLSGRDVRKLLQPQSIIEALREAYAALAENRADQGKSVGFVIEGGSIHVKSGLLPGSHLGLCCQGQRQPAGGSRLRRSRGWSRSATEGTEAAGNHGVDHPHRHQDCGHGCPCCGLRSEQRLERATIMGAERRPSTN